MGQVGFLHRACRALWVLAAALFAATVAAPAAADDRASITGNFTPTCHAASEAAVPLSVMTNRAAWNCSPANWRADLPVGWLWFDAQQWDGKATPRYFFTRTARHETIAIAALDANGALRTVRYTEADGEPFAAGPVFSLRLPQITDQTRAVLVRIERPHSIPLLTEARLAHDRTNTDWSQIEMMLLPLVMGMLILPLLFDFNFFLVLRERFVLVHAAMVVGMMSYVLFAGGLISLFVTLPVAVMAIMAPLSWSTACGAALIFLTLFLERGALSPLMQRITFWGGIWTIAVPGFFALQLNVTQSFDDTAYFLTILPSGLVATAAIVHALQNGSRSARFVACAWAPLLLASLERAGRGFGFYTAPSSLDQLMFLATGIEVVVISMAIADRFLALRKERDAALDQARILEQLSTRDSLTGLMNRRAIEARFEQLVEQGFDTFALVDLDRFKAVNDVHGHQIGDAALVACAAALRSAGDRDSLAVRLGGEEFVVLLKGDQAVERAEALRQAIPRRIAADVPGLGLPITASMGLIAMPRAASARVSFDEFYARADILLYEAKASGRNRMAYERLTIFSEAPKGRAVRRSGQVA
ncbi:MAG: GGDEF domain-containing protein [Porphyrobacter sp.]|jgi:diguanylate cyclase (GGDEF)-like protein|nr:GGDEF domain-containing protein [Porphyrobacter sp.]